MNKTLLVEILKKEFPHLKKAQITDALKICASRVSSKKSEKRREIHSTYCEEYGFNLFDVVFHSFL